eukprot:31519-Pelagococcus_subviridis.AAC.1
MLRYRSYKRKNNSGAPPGSPPPRRARASRLQLLRRGRRRRDPQAPVPPIPRPLVDLSRARHRQRMRQLFILRVSQIPPQRRRRRLVVPARLIQERVHVELPGQLRAPPGEFHEHGDDHGWVAGDEQRGAIARQLRGADPTHQFVIKVSRHEGRHERRDLRAERQQVRHREPHAVVAL